MDKPNDFNYYSGFSPYNGQMGYDDSYMDPNFFNPAMQYEQAYMYYRYLSQQMDYKIKCKEYDRLCGNKENRNDRKVD